MFPFPFSYMPLSFTSQSEHSGFPPVWAQGTAYSLNSDACGLSLWPFSFRLSRVWWNTGAADSGKGHSWGFWVPRMSHDDLGFDRPEISVTILLLAGQLSKIKIATFNIYLILSGKSSKDFCILPFLFSFGLIFLSCCCKLNRILVFLLSVAFVSSLAYTEY